MAEVQNIVFLFREANVPDQIIAAAKAQVPEGFPTVPHRDTSPILRVTRDAAPVSCDTVHV